MLLNLTRIAQMKALEKPTADNPVRIEVTGLTETDVVRFSAALDAAGFKYDEDYTTLYGDRWEITGLVIVGVAAEAFIRRMYAEELIVPRRSHGSPEDNSRWIERYKVGEVFVADAGAPGTGHRSWKVTRIDAEGLWGIILEDTIRELEPWEVM